MQDNNNCSVEIALTIWNALATETHLHAWVSKADIQYVNRRTRAEGLKFLTTTLPTLGKALESLFSTGQWSMPDGFFVCDGTLNTPRLFSAPFRRFIHDDGSPVDATTEWYQSTQFGDEVDAVDATACLAIRQLTLMFYKMKLGHNADQLEACKQRFHENEDRCWEVTSKGHSQWANPVMERARILVHRLLGSVNPYDIKPKHGSGASANRIAPWDRYSDMRYIPSLDAVYSYSDYFVSGLNGLSDGYQKLQDLPVVIDPGARVCFVEKDSRGPRQISCEPSEFMYPQQGLMSSMYDAIAKYDIVRKQLDCRDQTRNQRGARQGSIDNQGASIDMKDASDLVSYSLVRFLFPEDWIRAFDACRSQHTTFPDGEEVFLWKFAPMGSAVCFPVEAIVFWAITISVVFPELAERPFRKWSNKHTTVSIFGDDIVCPSSHAEKVMQALELAGLTVNKSKSYVTGPFRESCGTDWYRGRSVRVVRMNNPVLFSKYNRITIPSAFRLIDFLEEIQAVYGPWLDATVQRILQEWFDVDVPVLPKRPSATLCIPSEVLIPKPPDERRQVSRPNEPYYGGTEQHLLCERGVRRHINTRDWSHVLRALLEQSGDQAKVVGLAGRVHYKWHWVLASCVG